MIKALKDLFDSEKSTYRTHWDEFDNIEEVSVRSHYKDRDYASALKSIKRANWKASQVSKTGIDTDGNPFVCIKQPWCKGTRTVIEMINGQPVGIEIPVDRDNYITYTKLL